MGHNDQAAQELITKWFKNTSQSFFSVHLKSSLSERQGKCPSKALHKSDSILFTRIKHNSDCRKTT